MTVERISRQCEAELGILDDEKEMKGRIQWPEMSDEERSKEVDGSIIGHKFICCVSKLVQEWLLKLMSQTGWGPCSLL